MSRPGRAVLVISHEFPPSAGGGVQRVAKFARYLPDNGWWPVAVAGPVDLNRASDATLLDGLEDVRVVRVSAFDARRAVARLLAPLKRADRAGIASHSGSGPAGGQAAGVPLSTRVASWFSVPDHASFWIRPAVRAAVALGRHERVEAVFASGPPHSVLVAGSRVAAALGVPFVADMRDAWRDNPGVYYPTRLHRARALELERRVLSSAAAVTCVSEPIAAEARELGARDVSVVPNGFDPADLPVWSPEPGDLRLAFMGHMYVPVTDPAPLLDAMVLAAAVAGPGARVTLDIIGPAAPFVADEVAVRGMQDRVRFLGYRPHAEALRLVAGADAGVVLIGDAPGSRAIYTGKIFEYLGVGIPVLLIGPTDGVAADLVREAGAGRVVAYGEPGRCAETLVELADAKSRGETPPAPDPAVVGRFDRREQAAVLASILERATAR
jgi:glycosyltransferase involved in cell wall biosynthesis